MRRTNSGVGGATGTRSSIKEAQMLGERFKGAVLVTEPDLPASSKQIECGRSRTVRHGLLRSSEEGAVVPTSTSPQCLHNSG